MGCAPYPTADILQVLSGTGDHVLDAVYELGPLTSSPVDSFYWLDGGTCTQRSIQPSIERVAIGAPLDLAPVTDHIQ